jgi:uncharacterized protein (DUF2062 family)
MESARPGLSAVAPRPVLTWLRRGWRVGAMAVRRVLHLEDTPYRIAAGCAGGIFSSTLPIFGQAFVGMAVAWLLRGNVIASLPWTFISNPLTTLPIWYGGYRLGAWIWPGDAVVISYGALMERLQAFEQAGWQGGWSLMGTTLLDILGPLWLGTTLLGLALAIPGGLMMQAVVTTVQRRRSDRQRLWSLPARTGTGGPP